MGGCHSSQKKLNDPNTYFCPTKILADQRSAMSMSTAVG